jgi:hypothetical protein
MPYFLRKNNAAAVKVAIYCRLGLLYGFCCYGFAPPEWVNRRHVLTGLLEASTPQPRRFADKYREYSFLSKKMKSKILICAYDVIYLLMFTKTRTQ